MSLKKNAKSGSGEKYFPQKTSNFQGYSTALCETNGSSSIYTERVSNHDATKDNNLLSEGSTFEDVLEALGQFSEDPTDPNVMNVF